MAAEASTADAAAAAEAKPFAVLFVCLGQSPEPIPCVWLESEWSGAEPTLVVFVRLRTKSSANPRLSSRACGLNLPVDVSIRLLATFLDAHPIGIFGFCTYACSSSCITIIVLNESKS
jgi:hypothetical protein